MTNRITILSNISQIHSYLNYLARLWIYQTICACKFKRAIINLWLKCSLIFSYKLLFSCQVEGLKQHPKCCICSTFAILLLCQFQIQHQCWSTKFACILPFLNVVLLCPLRMIHRIWNVIESELLVLKILWNCWRTLFTFYFCFG